MPNPDKTSARTEMFPLYWWLEAGYNLLQEKKQQLKRSSWMNAAQQTLERCQHNESTVDGTIVV